MKIENFNGNIVNQSVDSWKLDCGTTIRALVISDLHDFTSYVKRAERLAKVIKEQNPDIIFIAGDIFGGPTPIDIFGGSGGTKWDGGKALEKFKRFLANISEVAPVCITWGNHDLRSTNQKNFERRLKNFKDLDKVRPGCIFPLYNDRVYVNGMEIIGFVPRFELMEKEGLKTQIHGIAHDEYIQDYEEKGVKFTNREGYLNVMLGHDPHLIAASENGIGLGSLKVCDFFITGHLHNGYADIIQIFNSLKKRLTGKESDIIDLDKGLVEQPTGIVDHLGNPIKGTKKLFGPSDLCRGIVYIDDDSQRKIMQLPNGKFYKNIATEPNVHIWQEIMEDLARKEVLEKQLHFMLISQGVVPLFVPIESITTVNNLTINGKKHIKKR